MNITDKDREKLNDIWNCLVGDPLNKEGLVDKVNRIDRKVDRIYDKVQKHSIYWQILTYISGAISTGIIAMIVAYWNSFWEYLSNK